MKFLENIVLKKVRPNFTEGGKFQKLYPAYDALETFLFTPDHTTQSGAHIRDAIDLKRTMMFVILAMVPCLIFGMWNVGHFHHLSNGMPSELWSNLMYGAILVVPIIIVSYAAGLGVEIFLAVKNGHSVQEGFLVSGMLIPLIMPASIPLWMVAVATIFAVLIGKEIFGGTGMNIVNVALTARAFIFFAYPTQIAGEIWIPEAGGVDGMTGATALGELAATVGQDKVGELAMSKMDMFGDGAVYSMYNSVMGFIPGSIGETSVIAILIGAAFLLWTGIASWRVMGSMFVGGYVMALLFNLWGANSFMDLPAMHQLMIGGFMFGMVFMATDPVTAAQTNTGKYIYGFLAGFFGIMIRVFNPAYPEGIMLAILFMNVMAPMIDHYVIAANIKRREKRVKLQTA